MEVDRTPIFIPGICLLPGAKDRWAFKERFLGSRAFVTRVV